MRVAITGASGSLGKTVTRMLLADDDIEGVVALDRRPLSLQHNKLQFIECDIRDENLAASLEGCDAVMHFAFVVEKSGDLEPSEIDDINVGGTQNLFTAAARAGVPQVVYASSIGAYGMQEENEGALIDESFPTKGNEDFYYFRNKAETENWINKFEKRHGDMTIARMRPSIFLTDRNPDRPAGLLALSPVMLSFRGVDTRVHLTYEGDVASAFVLALKKKAHGAYNVSTTDPLTLDEISSAAGRFRLALPTVALRLYELAWRFGAASMDPVWFRFLVDQSLLVKSDRIRNELGWEPEYPTTADVVRLLAGNLNEDASLLLKAVFRTPMLLTKVLGRVPLPRKRLEELTETKGSVNLVFTGEGGGAWNIVIDNNQLAVFEGRDDVASATITLSVDAFKSMLEGDLHLRMARMADGIEVEGNEGMLFIIAEIVSLFNELRDARGLFGMPVRQLASWLLSRS